MSNLRRVGEYAALLEPPSTLHPSLQDPYRVLALYRTRKPTGEFSPSSLVRRAYLQRVHKHYPALLQATTKLECSLEGWKNSAKPLPNLVAQARELLRAMYQEPSDPTLDRVRDDIIMYDEHASAESSRKARRLQAAWLFNRAVDLVRYFQSLEGKKYQRNAMYGDLLIEELAVRLHIPTDQLVTSLRGVVTN